MIDAGSLEVKVLAGIARLQRDMAGARRIVAKGNRKIRRAVKKAKAALA